MTPDTVFGPPWTATSDGWISALEWVSREHVPEEALRLSLDPSEILMFSRGPESRLSASIRDVMAVGADAVAADPDTVFSLEVDPATPFHRVDLVMDAVWQTGATRVLLFQGGADGYIFLAKHGLDAVPDPNLEGAAH